MTIRITKEEFLLLMAMYEQGLQMTILKKYENIDVPKKYNIDSYINLKSKMLNQASTQKITEEDLEGIMENFLDIVQKFNKNKKEKEDIMELYTIEMLKNEKWREEALNAVLKIIGKEG